MSPTLKLGLMVFGTLGVIYIVSYLIAEIIFRLTKEDINAAFTAVNKRADTE